MLVRFNQPGVMDLSEQTQVPRKPVRFIWDGPTAAKRASIRVSPMTTVQTHAALPNLVSRGRRGIRRYRSKGSLQEILMRSAGQLWHRWRRATFGVAPTKQSQWKISSNSHSSTSPTGSR